MKFASTTCFGKGSAIGLPQSRPQKARRTPSGIPEERPRLCGADLNRPPLGYERDATQLVSTSTGTSGTSRKSKKRLGTGIGGLFGICRGISSSRPCRVVSLLDAVTKRIARNFLSGLKVPYCGWPRHHATLPPQLRCAQTSKFDDCATRPKP